MTSANFGSIILTGFGNTAVQSYSPLIDEAHRAYNIVATTVGICDNSIVSVASLNYYLLTYNLLLLRNFRNEYKLDILG